MRRVLVVLAALVLVNLPWTHDAWTGHRITTSGVDVSATVVASRRIAGDDFVGFRLPERLDPRARTWSARVGPSTYDAARSSHRITVRVVPDHPELNRVPGQATSPLLLVIAVLGDVILLGVLAAIGVRWRRRRDR